MHSGDAHLKEDIDKTQMAGFYNRKVKEKPLKEMDLVLKKIDAIGKRAI